MNRTSRSPRMCGFICILHNDGIRTIKGIAYSAPMAFDRALCTPT